MLILIGGIVTTTRAARRAERRFNDVRTLANSFMFEFHDAIKDLQGATPARELVVRRALQYLDSLSQEATGDQALQQELASAYVKVGDVQGNHNFSNLGDTAGATASYRKAVEILEASVAAAPGDAAARRDLSISHIKLGDMALQSGDAAGVLHNDREGLRASEALRAADPANPDARRAVAFSHHKVGNGLSAAGDVTGSLEHHRSALLAHDFWIQPATFRPEVGSPVAIHLRVGEHFDGDAVPRDPAHIERFVAVSASGDRVVGMRLELTAVTNPYAMTAGQSLPLTLTYEGKPLAGALVVAINRAEPKPPVRGRTDAAGRVSLSLPRGGAWLVKAVHMVPAPQGSGADWESFWASVTFELPESSTPVR